MSAVQILPDGRIVDLDTGVALNITPPLRPVESSVEDDGAPAAAAAPPKAKRSAEPPNVLKLAKERKKYLDSEIRRLRKLEREREELVRLIDAAKTKPRAHVAQRGHLARPAN